MSETRNPPSGARGRTSQPELDSVRGEIAGVKATLAEVVRRLDEHEERLHDGDREMNTLAMDIRESSKLTREVLRVVNNLDQRVASEQTVRRSITAGRDVESKTPSRLLPSVSFGSVRASAPPWLFGALMTLALVLVAAVACVAVIVYFGHK